MSINVYWQGTSSPGSLHPFSLFQRGGIIQSSQTRSHPEALSCVEIKLCCTDDIRLYIWIHISPNRVYRISLFLHIPLHSISVSIFRMPIFIQNHPIYDQSCPSFSLSWRTLSQLRPFVTLQLKW